MWTVRVPKKVDKNLKRLPPLVQRAFAALIADLMASGPVAGNWPNYAS